VSTVKPQITARGRLSLLPSQDRPRQLHASPSFQSSLVPTGATLASNAAHNTSTHAVHVSPPTACTVADRAHSSVLVTPQYNASSAAHEEPLQRLERQVQDCNERIRQLEERLQLMEEKQRGDNTVAPH
jgi:TolA-binding protein